MFTTFHPLGIVALVPDPGSTLVDIGGYERDRRLALHSLVLLVVWTVWKERNPRIFRHTAWRHRDVVRYRGNDWIGAGFRSLAGLFSNPAVAQSLVA